MKRFKAKVGDRLVPANVAPWEDVRDELNSMVLGWSHYYSCGATVGAYKHVDWHVYQRARDFLTRRHKVQVRGTKRFSCDFVYGELGLIRLERLPPVKSACREPDVKPVGERSAGNPHAAFDEREEETEPWRGLRHRHLAKAAGNSNSPHLPPPRLISTLPLRSSRPLIPARQCPLCAEH